MDLRPRYEDLRPDSAGGQSYGWDSTAQGGLTCGRHSARGEDLRAAQRTGRGLAGGTAQGAGLPSGQRRGRVYSRDSAGDGFAPGTAQGADLRLGQCEGGLAGVSAQEQFSSSVSAG
ncbi:hypothetical protein CYMTET_52285 [Cymbomonas tetramitiformis]|uniref:Uncharacterized protein n=1 Tax=Cymbomonas tetramitiformis TaxID=36881 RepID=A0AAE0BL51_9CHLO|nr:hypothetical protein CYMTET_52285 [Cymbomonas tetramitiformis]